MPPHGLNRYAIHHAPAPNQPPDLVTVTYAPTRHAALTWFASNLPARSICFAREEADLDSYEAIEHFEAIWEGCTEGVSGTAIALHLATASALYARLLARSVSPRSVIGDLRTLRPRKAALNVLRQRIEVCERDLLSRGRTHPVNMASVTRAIWRATRV